MASASLNRQERQALAWTMVLPRPLASPDLFTAAGPLCTGCLRHFLEPISVSPRDWAPFSGSRVGVIVGFGWGRDLELIW